MATNRPIPSEIADADLEQMRADLEAEIQARKNAKATDGNALYVVVTDTWGYAPELVRGTFFRPSDVPYDTAWAEGMGAVRRATEYEAMGENRPPHETMPLEGGTHGRPLEIDEDAQASARQGASLEGKQGDGLGESKVVTMTSSSDPKGGDKPKEEDKPKDKDK